MNLFKKLYKMQEKMDAVVKNKKGHNYRYADLATVLKEIKPLLNEVGLLLVQGFEIVDGYLQIQTSLLDADNPEQQLNHDCQWPIAGLTLQQVGSARSYLCRYSLLTMFVVPIVDDDDGALAYEAAREESAHELQAKAFINVLEDDKTKAKGHWQTYSQSDRKAIFDLLDADTQKFMRSKAWKELGDAAAE